MMRKTLLFLFLAALPHMVSAQSAMKFAYFNYNEVLSAMPAYDVEARNISGLRAKYDAETKRSENDFHTTYEDILEGQRSYAPSILKKRKAALPEILDKNIAFTKEADRLIEEVE